MKCTSILMLVLFVAFSNGTSQQLQSPYPIIFVHGLMSDDGTWATTINELTAIWGPFNSSNNVFHAALNAYGGMTNIAGPDNILGNQDDDVRFAPPPYNQLASGSLFAVDFRCYYEQASGTFYVHDSRSPGVSESDGNESAIYKQGYALKKMIEAVLQVTGAEKVILVGHSMGGLAIREYLQRTEGGSHKWWYDPSDATNGHRVARVVTIGTPHRGCNSWAPIPGLDPKSEAIRDLKYSDGIEIGAYLFGGTESDLNPISFHNRDINCNGSESDFVVGVNESPNGTTDNSLMLLPTNVRYTWITSWFLLQDGDGVVPRSNQWLYLGSQPVPISIADTLVMNRFHTDEQNDYYSILRSLDEPDSRDLAYELTLNPLTLERTIRGLITYKQGMQPLDQDYYKVSTPGQGTLRVTIYWLSSGVSTISIQDASGSTIASEPVSNYPHVIQAPVGGGVYYIKVDGSATETSIGHPYTLSTSFTPIGHISITGLTLDKSQYMPGESTTLTVTLANSLIGAHVSCTVNGSQYTCADIGSGNYRTTFNAPSATATYPVSVTATKQGFANGNAQTDLVVYDPSARQLSVSSNPTSIVFDGQSSSTITSVIRDGSGNPVSGMMVSFSPPLSGPRGSCTPGSALTSSNGVAVSTYRPDGSGTASIQVSTSNGLQGTATVNVNSTGAGLYKIDCPIRVQSRTATTTVYELDPFVKYSSTGLGVDNEVLTLTTTIGTFQNNQQTYPDLLGDNTTAGHIQPLPLITTQTQGLATITLSVGQTTKSIQIEMVVGPVPTVQPFRMVTGSGSSLDNTEQNVSWSSDGSFLTVLPGTMLRFPSLSSVYSTETSTSSFSFSPGSQKAIFGRNSNNPVWYIYDIASSTNTTFNPSSTRVASLVWSKVTDNPVYSMANRQAGLLTEIKTYYDGSQCDVTAPNASGSDEIRAIDVTTNRMAVCTKDGYIHMYTLSSFCPGASPLWSTNVGRTNKNSLAFSPDGTKLAVLGRLYSGEKNLFIFENLSSSTPTRQLTLPSAGIASYYSLAWSPDNSMIVCGGENNYLKILNPTGDELYSLTVSQAVYGVAWSSQNIIAAVVGTGNTILFAPFDLDGPSLSISAPEIGFTTARDTVTFAGITNDIIGVQSVEMSLNGAPFLPMTLSQLGTFSSLVNIPLGESRVIVRSTDWGGRRTEIVRSVFRSSPPTVPLLLSPSDALVGLPTTVRLVWKKDSLATGYRVQLSRDLSFSDVVHDDSLVVDTTSDVATLAPSQTYYWRIRAYNPVGSSAYTGPWSFSTMGLPMPVLLITPAQGASQVPIPATFIWHTPKEASATGQNHSGSDASQAIGRYWFELASDSATFTNALRDTIISDTSKTVDDLFESTSYFWRVKAKNEIGWGAFSNWRPFLTRGPLPVQLASFTARVLGDRVALSWRTIGEVNNYGFYVHRRAANDSVFVELEGSFIPGHGTTNDPQHYSFVDSNLTPGVARWYYRLKQVDLDGTIHLTEQITVNITTGIDPIIEIPKTSSLSQNYPNPFNPSTTIQFALPVDGRVSLKVFNLVGEVVATLAEENLAAGIHSRVWDAVGLSSGVYFCRLQAGEFISTKKMLLLR